MMRTGVSPGRLASSQETSAGTSDAMPSEGCARSMPASFRTRSTSRRYSSSPRSTGLSPRRLRSAAPAPRAPSPGALASPACRSDAKSWSGLFSGERGSRPGAGAAPRQLRHGAAGGGRWCRHRYRSATLCRGRSGLGPAGRAPFKLAVPKGQAWYLVYRPFRQDDAALVAFRDWLMANVERDPS